MFFVILFYLQITNSFFLLGRILMEISKTKSEHDAKNLIQEEFKQEMKEYFNALAEENVTSYFTSLSDWSDIDTELELTDLNNSKDQKTVLEISQLLEKPKLERQKANL